MLTQILLFVVALVAVIRGSTLATKYAARVAQYLQLSKYTVGFLIIAVISILPEAMIAVNSAINGIPAFGLGTILGSNVADLTLIFALIVLFAGRGIQIEQKILKNQVVYPFILLLPIVMGLDGHFTRIEGVALVLAGVIFYYLSLRGEFKGEVPAKKKGGMKKNLLLLIASLAVLLVGAHFIVSSASAIAMFMNISPVIIGILIVGIGTTMPEFLFSLKAVKRNDDALAIGDILGTALADATIVIGLIALINPFFFPKTMIYVGGVFMVVSALILFIFMRSGKTVSKSEALALFLFWATFVLVEVILAV